MAKLNENSKLDLHIHSNASDGTLNPKEIVEEALKCGLNLIALTDHDEFRNIEEIKIIAKNHGISFIPGIEISSTFQGNLYHILAYGTDNNNKELVDLLDYNKYLLEKRNDNSIKYLIEKGYDIDYLEYENYDYDVRKGGWKALNFLIDKGICKDVGDYFNRLFYKEKTIIFPEFSSTDKVIKIIKSSGGIPILAHPYYEGDNMPVEAKLRPFLEMGIMGVECFHPNHSKDIMDNCVQWCKEEKLIYTSGSDFHGGFIEVRRMGRPETRIKDVNLGELIELVYE